MDATDDKKQCTNCKCWRDYDMFIGKKGDIVKRCLRCREKDAIHKSKPEVREKRNARAKEKAYHRIHRAKKRAENEEEYLANNAEVMRNWRSNNKEHLKAWRMQNVNYMLHAIKGQAKAKGIPWELQEEHAQKMMTSPCVYCAYVTEEHVNGIDRMDNNKGYTENNCVSCCKYCNFIKKALDPITFIERCKHIACCHGVDGQLNQSLWNSTKSVSYQTYKIRADKKQLSFELSVEQFNNLVNANCYYCHKQNNHHHKNGIDRKDNSKGYIIENCVACCGECNLMKADMLDVHFIDHIMRVTQHNKDIDITPYQNIPRCYCVVSKRKIKNNEE